MSVYRAFIINGGTVEKRKQIAAQINRAECIAMMGHYEDENFPNQLGVLHADEHKDFEDITMKKLKELAGENMLPPNFEARKTFSENAYDSKVSFGIIQLDQLSGPTL